MFNLYFILIRKTFLKDLIRHQFINTLTKDFVLFKPANIALLADIKASAPYSYNIRSSCFFCILFVCLFFYSLDRSNWIYSHVYAWVLP